MKILHCLLMATLIGCAGVAPGGGGGSPGAAPGGAVGSGGSGETSLGAGPGPGAPTVARANPEGVLSAPADDSFLEDCDPKAMLFYGEDYKKLFDASVEKSATWNQVAEQPFVGKFNIVSAFLVKMAGLQVRVFYVDTAASSYAYRDYQLAETAPGRHELNVEYAKPAAGSRIELFYVPGVKPKAESGETLCQYPKRENFSAEWASLTAAQYEELYKSSWPSLLAVFNIQIFHKLDRPELGDVDATFPAR